MTVFVVGGTGFIGGHAARAMAGAGLRVSSLARTPEAKASLESWGINALIGDAFDQDVLVRGVEAADDVVFTAGLGEQEGEVVSFMLDRMAGSGKSFVFCSGTGVLGQRTAGSWSEDSFSEADEFVPVRALQSRVELEKLVLDAASRGLSRGIVVRPPAVWTEEKPHSLVTDVVMSVRKTGAACFIGAGLNMYSHVHAQDLGEVFRQVVEQGRNGAVYHAVAGEVPNRWIAETVAAHMNCPTRSVTMDEAIELWGKFTALVVQGVSSRSRSPRTRQELGWLPVHTDMLAAAKLHLEGLDRNHVMPSQ